MHGPPSSSPAPSPFAAAAAAAAARRTETKGGGSMKLYNNLFKQTKALHDMIHSFTYNKPNACVDPKYKPEMQRLTDISCAVMEEILSDDGGYAAWDLLLVKYKNDHTNLISFYIGMHHLRMKDEKLARERLMMAVKGGGLTDTEMRMTCQDTLNALSVSGEMEPKKAPLKLGVAPDIDEKQTPKGSPCAVCLTNNPSMAFIPCGHMCLCTDCSPGWSYPACPMCRGPFTGLQKIYVS